MRPCDRETDVPHAPGSAYPDSEPAPGTTEKFYEKKAGELLLWTGAIGAPILWAIQFQTNYALVEWACKYQKQYVLQWINAGFFLGAIACGLISFWIWKQIGLHWPRTEDEGIRARTRLLAVVGVLSALLFGLLIVAQAIPMLLFGPCEV